jgi:hypothetical protein
LNKQDKDKEPSTTADVTKQEKYLPLADIQTGYDQRVVAYTIYSSTIKCDRFLDFYDN